jgi:hypothetical protein
MKLSQADRSSTIRNIRWGMTRGLQLALVYCVFALIVSAANPRAFAANDVTLAEVLVLYVATGLGAGAIVGSMRPLLSEKRTAYFPAIVAATVSVFGAMVMLYGPPATWNQHRWTLLAIAGVLFGMGGIHSFWPSDEDM